MMTANTGCDSAYDKENIMTNTTTTNSTTSTTTSNTEEYTTMSEKRKLRAEGRVNNPTKVGAFNLCIGDTKALMTLLNDAEDNIINVGPWAIAGKVGVGVAISFDGSTMAVHAWTGMQEMYYFLKDLMLATWEKMKHLWSWLLGLLPSSTSSTSSTVSDSSDAVSKDAAVKTASAGSAGTTVKGT